LRYANYQYVLWNPRGDVCASYRQASSPALHVRYNDFKAVLRIPDGELLEGDLPRRQMKLLQAWVEIRQDELMADWHLASTGQTPFKIAPLQ
jgi:hypothetical protein